VAVFDATNTTKARRKLLTERAREEKNALLVFIESICDDPEILAQNYKLKLQNDDYKHQDQQQALAVRFILTDVFTLLLSLYSAVHLLIVQRSRQSALVWQ
jgi:6-phosphofructo-2-kinase